MRFMKICQGGVVELHSKLHRNNLLPCQHLHAGCAILCNECVYRLFGLTREEIVLVEAAK